MKQTHRYESYAIIIILLLLRIFIVFPIDPFIVLLVIYALLNIIPENRFLLIIFTVAFFAFSPTGVLAFLTALFILLFSAAKNLLGKSELVVNISLFVLILITHVLEHIAGTFYISKSITLSYPADKLLALILSFVIGLVIVYTLRSKKYGKIKGS
jgi:hypothetical protein